MYEGAPDWPDKDRWWDIIERYGVTILYTAPDRDPRVHEVGHRVPRAARPLVAPAAGLGRRADQPRGVGLVLEGTSAASAARSSTRGGRPRPGAIMITPAARAHDAQAGLGDVPVPGLDADVVDEGGNARAAGRRRLPRAHASVAGDAARHLGRPRPLRADLLAQLRPEASTSPATAPGATRTATTGCSAGSTTS